MATLEDVFDIDPNDPEVRLAGALAREDRDMLRSLVRLRKQQGLSQTDVAARLGISQASVAAFERYDNDPKLSTIRRYAQVVGLMVRHHATPAADSGKWVHAFFIPTSSSSAGTASEQVSVPARSVSPQRDHALAA